MNPIKPDHYKGNRFEAIDIIEDYDLNFNLGNTIKYVLRSGKKDDELEDLEKAEFYIKREIDRLITERLESTDAVQIQEYHKSNERIADLVTADDAEGNIRRIFKDADEREMW